MDNEMITTKIPAVALRGLTILPDMIIHFDLSRSKSIKAVEQAMMVDEKVMLVTQKNPDEEEPGYEDVYHVGTIATVKQVNKLPNSIVRVLVEGQSRGTLLGFRPESEEFLLAEVQEIPTCEGELDDVTEEAMIRQLAELFGGYSKYYPKIGRSIEKQFQVQKSLEKLIDLITMSMPLSFSSKQKVLELPTVTERFDYLAGVLYNEIEIARVKVELSEKVKGRVEKNQK